MDGLSEIIKNANIEVAEKEANIYDSIHPEIFGSYEQSKITRDLEIINAALPQDSNIRVLDIGCGTGNLTLKFLELGYSITALDLSAHMVNVLRSKAKSFDPNKLEIVIKDIDDFFKSIGYQEKWHVISFSSVLHHLPDYSSILSLAFEHLYPKGLIYICHEPLLQEEPKNIKITALIKLLDMVDITYIHLLKGLVYLKYYAKTKNFVGRINYCYSDYYSKTGIDISEFLNTSEEKSVLLYETYTSSFSSLIAKIQNYIRPITHTHFRAILQYDNPTS
jgi:2-polyprenyl-3-methyl-5-hydroxy-6-metoxy-1,4-benzoquinol methylase